MTVSPYDQLFAAAEKRYGIVPNMLKALSRHESRTPGKPDWWPRAYRYEPRYWELFLKDDLRWAGKDPRAISASYGLCQVLYTTAVSMGFDKDPVWLYDPATGIEYGARYLRLVLDQVWREKEHWYQFEISAMDVALARYNGGGYHNPDDQGKLRNQWYVDLIMAEWERLKA